MDKIEYQKQNSLVQNRIQNKLFYDSKKSSGTDSSAEQPSSDALKGSIFLMKDNIASQRNSNKVQYDFSDQDSDLKFL